LIAVIGGCFGALLTMIVGLFSPVGVVAQSQPTDATFGTITCQKITVVDESGNLMGSIFSAEDGGFIGVVGKDGLLKAAMATDEHGGRVEVYKDGNPKAVIGTDEHGGHVEVAGKGSNTVRAAMRSNEYGGSVAVWGKGSDTTRAAMGVTEYGDGAVSTWDKNGYRQ